MQSEVLEVFELWRTVAGCNPQSSQCLWIAKVQRLTRKSRRSKLAEVPDVLRVDLKALNF